MFCYVLGVSFLLVNIYMAYANSFSCIQGCLSVWYCSHCTVLCSHLAALLGKDGGQCRGGLLHSLMVVLMLMLMLMHLLLVLADAVMVLALLPLAHVVDERPLLVLLAEGTVFAHLLLGLYLLALF